MHVLLSLEAASLSCLLPLPSVLCSPESTSKSLSGNSAAFWAGTQPLLLAISPALGPYVLPPRGPSSVLRLAIRLEDAASDVPPAPRPR